MTRRTIKTTGIAMVHELRFTATWVSVMRLALVLILSLPGPWYLHGVFSNSDIFKTNTL